MVRGFARCRTLNSKFGGHMEYVFAYRRVDTNVASWWCDDMSAKGITCKTSNWEDFKQFLSTRFVEKSVVMKTVCPIFHDAPPDPVDLIGLPIT
jgi:hypothetical protein